MIFRETRALPSLKSGLILAFISFTVLIRNLIILVKTRIIILNLKMKMISKRREFHFLSLMFAIVLIHSLVTLFAIDSIECQIIERQSSTTVNKWEQLLNKFVTTKKSNLQEGEPAQIKWPNKSLKFQDYNASNRVVIALIVFNLVAIPLLATVFYYPIYNLVTSK